MNNSELKRLARERLSSNWGQPMLVEFIAVLLTSLSQYFSDKEAIIGIIFSIFIIPIQYGVISYFLKFIRKEDVSIEILFSGYKDFSRILITQIVSSIFIILWTFLFIIPGIIKGLAYSMTLYILHDDPSISAMEALNLSEKMMNGRKMDLFLLHLSFLGWFILSIFTFGILLFWIIPYMETTICYFYEETKEQYSNKNVFIE